MSQSTNDVHSGLDPVMPIAIIGVAGRYPGDACNPERLWDMISEGRSAMSEVPKDRFNVDAFYHPHNERSGTLNTRNAHFMNRDVSAFDAPFFSITPNEAKAMDPQQRYSLECCYEALENAGIRIPDIAGTDTSVFVGSFSKDYNELSSIDPEEIPLYFGVGTGSAMLSNRLSWWFDLHGPSVSLDVACSSSGAALHLGCQSLRTGESSISIIGGVNLILLPGIMTNMSSLHFLSEDGVCHSFDESANGYSRGEGASFLVIKPLDAALRDGDVIRGVIRNTACGQDGNGNAGITVPNGNAQEALIRKCYADAGLSLADTQYVEAHGTGTQAGDPAETAALSATLGMSRPKGDPLLIGSVKTNVGHLEGAAAALGVTKAIFCLEKGEIPATIGFKTANPRIPMEDWNLRVVDKLTPWPSSGPRRVSINSFGYGGTNAHIIIDDAYHYLKARGLSGNHNTTVSSGSLTPSTPESVDSGLGLSPQSSVSPEDPLSPQGEMDYFSALKRDRQPRLYVWSSNEQPGVQRSAQVYKDYLGKKASKKMAYSSENQLLAKFAHTLSNRRTFLPWKSFAVASSLEELCVNLGAPPVSPVRSVKAPKLGFVFTGQGAQWFAMGRELCAFPSFQRCLADASTHLLSLGSPWSLLEEFNQDEKSSQVNLPAISQPLCTALQIALVDLLAEWNIKPNAVVGHSSGEIAAAYCTGALSREAAWEVAYHRGRLAAILPEIAPLAKGSMLATNVNDVDAQSYINRLIKGYATVACVNSPESTTISGDLTAIVELEEMLKEDGRFARKLQVTTAYHSKHMTAIAELYESAIKDIELNTSKSSVIMFSSVTGHHVEAKQLGPRYWVHNMVKPVEFSGAVHNLCHHTPSKGSRSRKPLVDVLVEIGPHSALQGPLKQIIKAESGKFAEVASISLLSRGRDARITTMEALGTLFQRAYPVNLSGCNGTSQADAFLVDIPPFAFNHGENNRYWHESQASKNTRFRAKPRTDLLGAMIPQSNVLEPVFRNILRVTEIPWIEHHRVQGTILYPAAGMLVMAIESCVTRVDPTRVVEGYELRDVIVGKAIVIPEGESGTETLLKLRPWRTGTRDLASNWEEFRIYSRQGDVWELNCSGLCRPKYKADTKVWFADEEKATWQKKLADFHEVSNSSPKLVDIEAHYGHVASLGYGFSGPFKSVRKIHKGHFRARTEIEIPDTAAMMPRNFEFPHIIHPSTLDCVFQTGIAGASSLDGRIDSALIPVSAQRLFVSVDIPVRAGAVLHCSGRVENEGFENARGSFTVYDDSFSKPLIVLEGVKSSALRQDEFGANQGTNIRKLAAHFHWQQDIEKISLQDLQHVCATARAGEVALDARVTSELEHASYIFMRNVVVNISPKEAASFAPHMQKYYSFMQKTLQDVMQRNIAHQHGYLDWLVATPSEEEALLKRVAASSADGAALCKHGKNLVRVLRGEALAIEVLMEDNLLNNFYQYGVGNAQIYAQLGSVVDLLGHKNPDMKILEIGGGTGGATLPVLSALGGQNGTSPRFSTYTFTDISSGFFEKAHEKFKPWLPFMDFAKMDVSTDPLEQGFKAGQYDLIIAANVLHATASMDETLKNCQKLLKPEGKLIVSEITNCLLRFHMIVGSFEGWWAGAQDGREWGPTMTQEVWNTTLLRNGFSGVELALDDLEDAENHAYTLMVSTASTPPPEVPLGKTVIIRAPQATSELTEFTLMLQQSLEANGAKVRSLDLHEVLAKDLSQTSVISLLDCDADHPFLSDIAQTDFQCVKHIVSTAHYSAFLSRGAAINSEHPFSGLMTGMARCIRAESGPTFALLTLDLDASNAINTDSNVATVVQVYKSGATGTHRRRPDWEYAIRDNKVMIQRILLENGTNELISSLNTTPKRELMPFVQEGRPLTLGIETPGRLDTLQLDDDAQYYTDMKPDDVEIAVGAAGLNFKDVMIAMGQLQEPTLGMDCSGVVSRVGQNVSNVKVGDRVMTWTSGAFCNFARSPASMVSCIPDSMSFAVAASVPLVWSTVVYSLINTARLQNGDSILIHGAAGGVGQAAVMLAKHIGAEIYATVSSESKKQLIMDTYSIPEDHIFSSRDLSFAAGVMRMTRGRGVDVVLNSLAGEALQVSWDCIAWFGRFIEIGKKDIESNTGLSMEPFGRNTTYSSIDLTGLKAHDLKTCSKVFANVVKLLEQGVIAPVQPIVTMPFSKLEEAFRTMQMGKHIGKLVLEVNDNDIVPVIPARVKPYNFRSDATYLLSGGTGGLGRSIAKWMVKQGARNLVFLSRSGPSKPEAQDTISALTEQGARAVAYSCDISNRDDMKRTLDTIRDQGFPPIRGAIQGAMVLHDAMFCNMSHEQYLTALRPKVQGTWNMHELLPKNLDFFVLLSSSAGIAGSRGQSNYAAGNAFQDALAYHRRAIGQAAGAIDLGVVLDVGYVAESTSTEVRENTKRFSFVALREMEVHALIQASITGESIRGQKVPPQIITGLGTGGMAKFAGYKIPWWFSDAKFAHVRDVDTHTVSVETEDTLQLQTLLAAATSFENATEIVGSALVQKLSKSLMVPAEDIELSRPMSRYGVDSLLAVEVRSWLFTELQSDISVFQLLSNGPITDLVKTIIGKSKCVPSAFQAEI
ncbi:hypothetical protein AUEXF2481DRAFT_7276 [Aureobasidium subglaciale EXF-2481]|uniref:Uncharacterized protein n=1 Tax=Aureobasidium subglaciale (strain EXF-2481) TaxID=1043005 RepID=A0A074YAA3_AURSE|nr:uncharacterized protein AUEXF2481DRAFT_7276 [Aureobasidium subglaciale EXF-2481]KAI5217919.1 putative polyketide synthase [Aureobasidium subglaciale]KAI5221389.1 putative polyketide synthase [Aureobasidium subglaciale]KEQ92914.1 hypothetical protein AUEXF2481DRAFT_7276 [Aureobasidium subglaciale EXF-2481]